MEAEIFNTQEAILALCLTLAGCEPLDARQPCINLFDAEILGKLGYKGMPVGEAAIAAWKDQKKGHVEYVLKRTPRLLELLRAYRDQCQQIEKSDGKSFDMLAGVIADMRIIPYDTDEAILRIACVVLKTRGSYINLWKQMVPLLRIPVDGTAKHFDSSIISKGKTVEAKGVHRPGFQVISLNLSAEKRKEMGL